MSAKTQYAATAAREDVQTVLKAGGTKSARIRSLFALGIPKAEIALILEIRYQHVRNVLEAPAPKAKDEPVVGEAAEGEGEQEDDHKEEEEA